jgi:hypothetical protein
MLRDFMENLTKKNMTKNKFQENFKNIFRQIIILNFFLAIGVLQLIWGMLAGLGGDRDCTDRT